MTDDLRYQELSQLDPDVYEQILGEVARQRNTLEMIASENFVPRAVPVSYTHLTLPTICSV